MEEKKACDKCAGNGLLVYGSKKGIVNEGLVSLENVMECLRCLGTGVLVQSNQSEAPRRKSSRLI